MKYLFTLLVLVLGFSSLAPAQQPWQHLNMPEASEVAAHFRTPPPAYGPTVTWGWDGAVTREVIERDLDQLQALGYRAVTIEAGYEMNASYLSPGWFRLMQTAAEEAEQRGMGVWIIDEGKYPTGFAGGKFSQERPDLRMQVLIPGDRIPAKPGQRISRSLSQAAISAVAYNPADSTSRIIDVSSGALQWTVPPGQGDWEILVVEHQFRTSPTRAVNNPTRAKDTSNSLMNYLDPNATRQFMAWTHKQYQHYLGSQFGKAVLGFRSDEPAYYRTPWAPDLSAEFERQKGYDVRPYLAAFFTPKMSDEVRRVKADYWDVWTDMYRENFFRLIADWCEQNHLEYVDHLDKDGPETNQGMLDLTRSEGDFFQEMQALQIPGIDAIWNQVWPGKVANFPKLASSAAHLFGRPRSFSESFAAYRPAPTVDQARWAVNYQLARGINLFEFMFYPASSRGRSGPRGYMAADNFPALADYTNRACYLLSQGHPAAQIALLFPTSSLWLQDTTANTGTWQIAQQLVEHQQDFDLVDDRTLVSALTLHGDVLTNDSGQSYRTVILTSPKVITRAALDRLHSFAQSGGRVILLGRSPALVAGSTFRNAIGPPDVSWIQHEPRVELSRAVLNALPRPDVQLDQPASHLQYVHRHWDGAELYFFFNESDRPLTRQVTLTGPQHVEFWNTTTSHITQVSDATVTDGNVKLPLSLEPYGTRFVVLRAAMN